MQTRFEAIFHGETGGVYRIVGDHAGVSVVLLNHPCGAHSITLEREDAEYVYHEFRIAVERAEKKG